jgi:HAE1 family hydrophobic/amphiphilic exporter-1
MAASLCFGLMTSTVLVLILVPTFYNLYARIFGVSVDEPSQLPALESVQLQH